MIKLCQFPAHDQQGHQLIEIFRHPDQLHHSYMDKVASPFLPEIRTYLDGLKPNPNSIYALVNALGAFEYWSSNINSDGFEEEFLIHRGPVYGYETFLIYAKPFQHHQNKDPKRAFGAVELAVYNTNMHRVELIVRIDRDAAERVGAQRVVDKIDQGMLPSTSMGCKVPYDLSSITTDWELYRKALATYKPDQHRHPGIAVLQYHKQVKPISGLSITRDDYDDFLKYRANEILPDGRKVCAFNPYPRFFDISFVFIGADKTSYMMAKLASVGNRAQVVVPSSYLADHYGYHEEEEDMPATHKTGFEKAASVTSNSIERTRQLLRSIKEKKASQSKRAEITKEVVPSQFMNKAIPVLQRSEPDLPREVLDRMGEQPLREALSTPTMMGMVLRPHEFQRIALSRMGKGRLANDMDDRHQVFDQTDEIDRSIPMGPEFISKLIASLLKGSIDDRSDFGPPLTRRMIRITIIGIPKPSETGEPEVIKNDLMDKVSAAYNGYREQVVEKIAQMTDYLHQYPEVQAQIYGMGLEDVFAKTADVGALKNLALAAAIPGGMLLSRLAGMKIQRDLYTGKRPSYAMEMISEHPLLTGLAAFGGALQATGSHLPAQIGKGILNMGKSIIG
jgi:hypothetical protein